MRFTKEQGFSLVELMVGMLLASLAILTSLTLYSNLVKVNVESTTDAKHDGQLASAMSILQLELQSAGYGITPANPADLVLVDSTHLNWRFRPNPDAAVYTCRGFWVEDGNDGRIFKLITRKNCAANTNLNSVVIEDWDVDNQKELAQFKRNPPVIALSMENKSCSPFGFSKAAAHPYVTLSVQSSVKKNLSGAVTSSAGSSANASTSAAQVLVGDDIYHFCLSNM